MLFSEVVQNKLIPNMPNADASPKSWLAILDKLEAMKPRLIVPDHGSLGDGSLIGKERGFLLDLQTRALDFKRQGISVEEAVPRVTAELKAKYPDWESVNAIQNGVKRVYAEAP